MSSRNYLSAVETAKLMRSALKESFPGVKFSVRADGNSINVRWTDGPAAKLVEAVTDQFKGGYFDGMIDYAGSVYHKLDGKPVSFGSKYVFCSREDSDEAIAKAIGFLQGKYPGNKIEASVEDFRKGRLSSVYPTGGEWSWENSLQQMIWKAAMKRSSVAGQAKSATLARIEFEGDDGYGRGTVGLDGKGGESCYAGQEAARERARAAARIASIEPVAIMMVPAVLQ